MRLAATGDLHLTEGARFDDVLQVLHWVVEDAIAHKADAMLFGGDVAGHDAPHEMTKREENALSDLIIRAAARMPVLWDLGNHDRPLDFVPFERLQTRHPVVVVTRPRIVTTDDLWPSQGHLPPFAQTMQPSVAFYVLPYPSKLWAVGSGAIGGSILEQKQAIEATLRQLLLHWKLDAAEQRRRGVQHIVGLMHINIGGSIVGGGEQHIGREVEAAPHDLTELGFDCGILDHIHKPQEMAPNWRYTGSPAMQNHGESTDEKSYCLVDLEPGKAPVWTLRPTPTRKLLTVNATFGRDERGGQWTWVNEDVPLDDVLRGAEVRLRYTVPEEAIGLCNPDEFAGYLKGHGAHSVKLERKLIPKVQVRSEAITTAVTTAEKLTAWFDVRGVEDAQRQRVLEKLAALEG